ncbi:MAG: flavin reductase family protein [Bacteroidota bacterium]
MEGLLEELAVHPMTILPTHHEPRDIYRLMTGLIVPRPIAFVSTLSLDGVRNLAPFSFFTAISANPPAICFAPMIRGTDGSRKDTLRNIEAMKEFVVNIVSEDFARKMNACSFDYPPEVDEFAESGLTPIPSDLVTPPRVKESRAAMECRLLQVVHISPKPLGGSLVIGEILRFHVDDDIVSNFQVNPDLLRPIGRMGGGTYTRTTDRFEMPRPSAPAR